jgi:predicted glycosyltransferase
MAKLNEYTDRDLLNELTLRGYNTTLVFELGSVEAILSEVNANLDVEERIVMDYDDMEYILDRSMNGRHYTRQIIENIREQILDL